MSVLLDIVKEKIIIKNDSNHLNTAKLVNQIKKKYSKIYVTEVEQGCFLAKVPF